MKINRNGIIAIAIAIVLILVFGIFANPLMKCNKVELQKNENKKEEEKEEKEEKPIEFVEIQEEKKTGIYYETEYIRAEESSDVVDKDTLIKYDNGMKLWSVEFEEFNIHDYATNGDITVVYGWTLWNEELQTFYAWMALVDNQGNVIWKKVEDNPKDLYCIDEAVIEEDCIVVFGNAGSDSVYMAKYNFDGEQTFYKANEGFLGHISQYVKSGESYIVHLEGGRGIDEKVCRFEQDGNCKTIFVCSGEKNNYYIVDMLEHNGNVYFSAELEGEIFMPSSFDWEKDFYEYKGHSYLRKSVLNDYKNSKKSVLFKYNIDSGEVEAIQKVLSAIPAELEVNKNNELVWNLEEIITAGFSPETSSFSIYSNTKVSQCIFDENGEFLEMKKTDEIRYFQE